MTRAPKTENAKQKALEAEENKVLVYEIKEFLSIHIENFEISSNRYGRGNDVALQPRCVAVIPSEENFGIIWRPGAV